MVWSGLVWSGEVRRGQVRRKRSKELRRGQWGARRGQERPGEAQERPGEAQERPRRGPRAARRLQEVPGGPRRLQDFGKVVVGTPEIGKVALLVSRDWESCAAGLQGLGKLRWPRIYQTCVGLILGSLSRPP